MVLRPQPLVLVLLGLLACKPAERSRAESDAERDLAAGRPVILMSSGVARYLFTPDVDADTGLPFRDTGGVADPQRCCGDGQEEDRDAGEPSD